MTDTPMTPDRERMIRMRRTHCEATRFETEDDRSLHVWGPSQYPTQEMCQQCTVMRWWAEEADTDEAVLLAEVDRLRARVAELEALKPARFQECQICGAGYEYGQKCSACEFTKQMGAATGEAAPGPRDLQPGAAAARRMLQDRQDAEGDS